MIKNKTLILKISIITILLIATGVAKASNVIIDADRQTYKAEDGVVNFNGNVRVKMDDVVVKSPNADVTVDANGEPDVATFKNGAYAVQTKELSKHEIKSNILKLSLIKKRIKAEGNTQSVLTEKNTPVVIINADTQEFDINTNVMKASGSVIINYKDLETFSQEADIKFDKNGTVNKIKLSGSAKLRQDKNEVRANTFLFNPTTNELIATGSVQTETKLEDNTKVLVWSDYMQYDKVKNIIMSSGRVKINYQDYVATGPKAAVFPDKTTGKPNQIIFFGRSKIQQDNKLVEADKIKLNMNPKNFDAEGNVRTRFNKVNVMTNK